MYSKYGVVVALAITLFSQLCYGLTTEDLDLVRTPFVSMQQAKDNVNHLGQNLQAEGDRRALFPLVYALTISATLQRWQQGRFHNSGWVNRLVVNYANIYRQTILNELTDRRPKLPQAWQLEFNYVEQTKNQPMGTSWVADRDLVYGIHVHIARDLVEALFVTPTDFTSASVKDDFLQISETLRAAMPAIWQVFSEFTPQPYNFPQFGQSVMEDWIANLRLVAWNNAAASTHLNALERAKFLDQLDQKVERFSRTYGEMLPVLDNSATWRKPVDLQPAHSGFPSEGRNCRAVPPFASTGNL